MGSRRLVALVCLVVGAVTVPAPAAAPSSPAPAPAVPVGVAGPPAVLGSLPGARAVTQVTDGLTQEVSTSYRVDASALITRVSVSATLTNTTGNLIFHTYGIPAPAEATSLSARTAGGDTLPVRAEPAPDTEQIKHVVLTLGSRLGPGQRLTVHVSYELGRQPPRANSLSQANEALFMFPVWPLGDPGRSSVEVRVPAGYDIEVVGSDLGRSEQGDEVVLSAAAIADPREFGAVVLAMDEANLVTETTEVAGTTVELRAWPGDAEWVEFVAKLLEEGAEVLGELIGQPWPTDRDLTVVETMTPLARGYGGWYDASGHAIRIGNELDAHLVLHELSHVWINFVLFSQRWLLEGFAEEYAHRAAQQLGRTGGPTLPDPVPPEGRLVPLVEWASPRFGAEESDDAERYGYAMSWHVVGSIAEEVGMDAMREVIDAAADRRVTYPGGPEHGPLTVAMDWRRLLDLFENVAGSEGAAELFTDYVVTPGGQAEMEERSAARADYFDLVERGGEWVAPFGVRWDMAQWEFGTAFANMTYAGKVLDLRAGIEDVLDGLGVGPLALEDDYEAASDVGAVVPLAEDTLEAAEAYRTAEERSARGRNLLETVGLWWSGTGGRLDKARTGLEDGDPEAALKASRSVVSRLDDAARNGALRLGGLTFVVVGGVLLPFGRRRRRRGRFDAELDAFLQGPAPRRSSPEHGEVG